MAKNVIDNRHALDWAVLAWLAEPRTIVFWSTHSHVEAQRALIRLRGLIFEHPIEGLLAERFVHRNGEEEIRFFNGSRVIFRARTFHSGRGVAADKMVLDEAWALTDRHLGTLLSCVSAVPNSEVVYAQTEEPRQEAIV